MDQNTQQTQTNTTNTTNDPNEVVVSGAFGGTIPTTQEAIADTMPSFTIDDAELGSPVQQDFSPSPQTTDPFVGGFSSTNISLDDLTTPETNVVETVINDENNTTDTVVVASELWGDQEYSSLSNDQGNSEFSEQITNDNRVPSDALTFDDTDFSFPTPTTDLLPEQQPLTQQATTDNTLDPITPLIEQSGEEVVPTFDLPVEQDIAQNQVTQADNTIESVETSETPLPSSTDSNFTIETEQAIEPVSDIPVFDLPSESQEASETIVDDILPEQEVSNTAVWSDDFTFPTEEVSQENSIPNSSWDTVTDSTNELSSSTFDLPTQPEETPEISQDEQNNNEVVVDKRTTDTEIVESDVSTSDLPSVNTSEHIEYPEDTNEVTENSELDSTENFEQSEIDTTTTQSTSTESDINESFSEENTDDSIENNITLDKSEDNEQGEVTQDTFHSWDEPEDDKVSQLSFSEDEITEPTDDDEQDTHDDSNSTAQETWTDHSHDLTDSFDEFNQVLESYLTFLGTDNTDILWLRTDDEEVNYHFVKEYDDTITIEKSTTGDIITFTPTESGLEVLLNNERIAYYGVEPVYNDTTHALKEKLGKFTMMIESEHEKQLKAKKEEAKKIKETLRSF